MPPLSKLQRSCLALTISQAIALPAQSATINVKNNGDDQGCTLRNAIMSANADSSIGECNAGNGADTITFNGLANDSTISLTQGELVVNSNITVNGPGQDNLYIRSSNSDSRIFYVFADNPINSGALTLDGLTLVGGSVTGAGGGIYANGKNAIVNIINSSVSFNTASFGGGIASNSSEATINIINSSISNNSSGSDGGGIASFNSEVTINITNSTISNNSSGSTGGGISSNSSETITNITNSTVSSNSTSGFGGGIYSNGFTDNLNIFNSSVSFNSADYGGGVYSASDTNLSISNSTVSGNSARLAAGVLSYGSSIINNNIIAGNTGEDFNELYVSTFNNPVRIISNNLVGSNAVSNAQAFNIIPDSTNIFATSDELNLPLDQLINPSLENNGGPTLTHALPTGSPAINAGDNSICPTKDQRGVTRNDGKCDIDSVEYINQESFFVVPLPDGGSVIFSL